MTGRKSPTEEGTSDGRRLAPRFAPSFVEQTCFALTDIVKCHCLHVPDAHSSGSMDFSLRRMSGLIEDFDHQAIECVCHLSHKAPAPTMCQTRCRVQNNICSHGSSFKARHAKPGMLSCGCHCSPTRGRPSSCPGMAEDASASAGRYSAGIIR